MYLIFAALNLILNFCPGLTSPKPLSGQVTQQKIFPVNHLRWVISFKFDNEQIFHGIQGQIDISGKDLCLIRSIYSNYLISTLFLAFCTAFLTPCCTPSYLLPSLAHKFCILPQKNSSFCNPIKLSQNQHLWHPCKVVTAARQLYEEPSG